jgi:hypothetical protein
MAVNVQKAYEVGPLIDAQPRKLRAQLPGAVVCREAGDAAPQGLHFRRAVESRESCRMRPDLVP